IEIIIIRYRSVNADQGLSYGFKYLLIPQRKKSNKYLNSLLFTGCNHHLINIALYQPAATD
ncbi:hypothetical protein, partial [Fischerella thermalis]|uniref:hypothetical protein n=1 Tax=Fischerella thermalis TaxID=372787 RepID=UPI001CA521F1